MNNVIRLQSLPEAYFCTNCNFQRSETIPDHIPLNDGLMFVYGAVADTSF